MSEEETKELNKEQITMQQLCISLDELLKQKQQARINLARINISIEDLNSLIMARIEAIEELERKGIKRYKVEEKEPEQAPQKSQIPRGG